MPETPDTALPDADTLNHKQLRFVTEYLVDLNATQAAIRAGYSPDSAHVQGSRLLSNAKVSAAVEEELSARAIRTRISSDRVLHELFRLATVDPAEAYDESGKLKHLREMPPDLRRCIASIQVDELYEGAGRDRVQIGETKTLRFWDKPRALELLGKHHKLFTDKVQHSLEEGTKVHIEIHRTVKDAP